MVVVRRTISLRSLAMWPTVLRASTVALLSRASVRSMAPVVASRSIDRLLSTRPQSAVIRPACVSTDRSPLTPATSTAPATLSMSTAAADGTLISIADAAAVRAAFVSGLDHDFVTFFADVDVNRP